MVLNSFVRLVTLIDGQIVSASWPVASTSVSIRPRFDNQDKGLLLACVTNAPQRHFWIIKSDFDVSISSVAIVIVFDLLCQKSLQSHFQICAVKSKLVFVLG